MSDALKPNRDVLKLAVLLLTTMLTSGGVQRWLNADTAVRIMGNRNIAEEGFSEAKWSVHEIMDLRERVRKLEER